MKKLFLTSIVLMMAMMAQAQTKVAATMEKGYKVTYVEETQFDEAGEQFNAKFETQYEVTEVNDEGAVVELTLTDISSDANADDVTAQMLLIDAEIRQGLTIRLSTDLEGKVLAVLNADDVKTKGVTVAEQKFEALAKKVPALAAVPKELILEQLSKSLSEDKLIEEVDVLMLNGKTVMNGATEGYTNAEGLKMKRMYFVAGKNIICNASLDMTKDELKALVIRQFEVNAPEQAEMIKQNIDMVMGQLTIDSTEKSTYEFQANGWPLQIKTESRQTMMGQESKVSSVIKVKEN